MKKMAQIKKNKLPPWFYIVLLAVIFFGPLFGAWFLYSSRAFVPEVMSNGHLIQPPLNIKNLVLYKKNGKTLNVKELPHDWIMLYVEPKECGPTCFDNLYKMRQIRKALGKESPRVARMIITLNGYSTKALNQYLVKEYKGTIHVSTNKKALDKFLQNIPSKKVATSKGYLYLMDPLGNVMMSYQPEQKPRGIYKDLKRLLKASQIG